MKVVANPISINDTMHHTRTVRDMGTLYAFPIHIQGMSAIRIPQFRKLPHFQARIAKTLSICLLFIQ